MAIAMFMKVEGADGESKDSQHQNWTDILSFSWGATQPGSMATGGGGGAGKVSFNDLRVQAHIDKSTSPVLKHCATGKHLGKVEISVCKAGGDLIEYARITLEDVLVTQVEYSGTGHDEGLTMNYSFQASRVKQQYWEQDKAGGKGAESIVGYDIKQNKET